MSDSAIIVAVGSYVKHHRLDQNLTQAQVALEAGINRWTLSQLENGEGTTLNSLLSILRALDLLEVFESFRIEKQISPIEMARMEHQKRERASGQKDQLKNSSNW